LVQPPTRYALANWNIFTLPSIAKDWCFVDRNSSPHDFLRFLGPERFLGFPEPLQVEIAFSSKYSLLVGGFKYFLCSSLLGEDEPNLTNVFQRGLKPPASWGGGSMTL